MSAGYNIGTLFQDSISAVTSTPLYSIGQKRYYAGEEYVYCYNAGNSEATQGFGMRIITGASGASVTITSVTGFTPYFCVVAHATATTGQYFWGMKNGFTHIKASNTSLLSGYCAYAANNGYFGNVTGVSAHGMFYPALCLESTATGGSAYAHIHCF